MPSLPQGVRLNTPWLSLNNNKYIILSRVIDNIFCYDLNNEKLLREIIIKIELERIDIQEKVMVETLLDSRTTGWMISSEFIRK